METASAVELTKIGLQIHGAGIIETRGQVVANVWVVREVITITAMRCLGGVTLRKLRIVQQAKQEALTHTPQIGEMQEQTRSVLEKEIGHTDIREPLAVQTNAKANATVLYLRNGIKIAKHVNVIINVGTVGNGATGFLGIQS